MRGDDTIVSPSYQSTLLFLIYSLMQPLHYMYHLFTPNILYPSFTASPSLTHTYPDYHLSLTLVSSLIYFLMSTFCCNLPSFQLGPMSLFSHNLSSKPEPSVYRVWPTWFHWVVTWRIFFCFLLAQQSSTVVAMLCPTRTGLAKLWYRWLWSKPPYPPLSLLNIIFF